ncbi:DMT family transporter [Mycobacteroides salmoniphilum]|uniref:DMT family transporter n=1 Tax=Mycobacteroides salmoniphilum TaxID=404941 RepID=UPI001B7D9007|nr:DMT family transporter [Mycobacteroides salmoniphilum]
MTGQRARSSVEADHRSAHPDIPGVPWWGAILIAVAGTALGFAIDAMTNGEKLTGAFAGCYAAGCVVAVFAVRHSSIFTAVVQPPLILFASIPMAYMVMSQAPLSGGKSTAITIGYPLIERFPLMISTALGVLIIGVVRWYWGIFAGRPTKEKAARPARTKTTKTTKPKSSARTRVQALVDADATGKAAGSTARTRRPRADEPAARTRHGRHESGVRRRPTHDSEPVSRRTSAVGTPWEDERPMRTERRPARRVRDEYDEYGYEPRPRYREPLAEPTREPHRPAVRYRDERPPTPPRRRQDRYDDAWDYDR